MKALVGYTGFVGSNILRQEPFDLLINSKNSDELKGRHFQKLVWSGVKAEKWKANLQPDEDALHIRDVIDLMNSVTADQAVLISTVDVYPNPLNVDEDTELHGLDNHAYGRHRLAVEDAFRVRFPEGHIVRLPGLFGDGLKKNIIFDFMRSNETSKIHADSAFQFYFLDWLKNDIDKAIQHNLPLINLTSAPLSVADVAKEGFRINFDNRPPTTKPVRYDVKSRHDDLWQGENGYLYPRAQVVSALQEYLLRASERGTP